MDDLIIFGGVIAVFLGAVLIGLKEERKRKKILRQKLKEGYGEANSRELKPEELERISYYTKEKTDLLTEQEDFIDELTWKDLEMDELYCRMAFTRSSIGDDYLYYLLHHPQNSKKRLKELEDKISYYQNNAVERLELQVRFEEMGRLQHYSLARYIRYMEQIRPGNNLIHHGINGLLLLALIFMFFKTQVGLVLFLALLCYNIISYFRYKREMAPCLSSFRYLLSLLESGKKIEEALNPVWKKEKEYLKERLHQFKGFRKNAYLLGSGFGVGGNELEIVLDYLRMFFHLDIIKFNSMLGQLQERMDSLWELYERLGELDSCLAIGAYRESLPFWCVPVFTTDKMITVDEGYHPLIEEPVENSVKMDKSILLTGSNASGKSTFLKMMGINLLLAQTIHTCLAKEMNLPFCCLYTAISLKDNVLLKESYYMAEIRAIKRILDAADKKKQVVCMVDEVLRGTNTVERIAAASQILKCMCEKGILCIAATHDGELTWILEKEYQNCHFEEEVNAGDIRFSYKLKEGSAVTSNAILLLENMGYPAEVAKEARKMIDIYKQKGEWK